jgi:hypothetical protein
MLALYSIQAYTDSRPIGLYRRRVDISSRIAEKKNTSITIPGPSGCCLLELWHRAPPIRVNSVLTICSWGRRSQTAFGLLVLKIVTKYRLKFQIWRHLIRCRADGQKTLRKRSRGLSRELINVEYTLNVRCELWRRCPAAGHHKIGEFYE